MARILRHKLFLLFFTVAALVVILNSCVHYDKDAKTEYQPYRIGAVEYISLDSFCYKFDMQCEWQADNNIAVIQKNAKEMLLFPESQTLSVEGENKRLLFPIILRGEQVMIPREIEKLQWWSDAQSHSFTKRLFRQSLEGKKVVVLDAGHGGHETGAVANGIQEKDITYRVTQLVKQKLINQGIEVVMTREIDEYLSLPDRTWIANTIKPDLFVSIHANAAGSEKAQGTETFHVPRKFKRKKALLHDSDASDKDYRMKRNPLLKKQECVVEINEGNREKSETLAELVHQKILRADNRIKDRGVKQAEFFLLKWINAPSVLVELGFVTNFLEGSRLMDPSYQEKLATNISLAIEEYLNQKPAS